MLGGLKARRLASLEASRISLLGCSWGFFECSWSAPWLLLGAPGMFLAILGWPRDLLGCSWDGLTVLRGSLGVVLECSSGLLCVLGAAGGLGNVNEPRLPRQELAFGRWTNANIHGSMCKRALSEG